MRSEFQEFFKQYGNGYSEDTLSFLEANIEQILQYSCIKPDIFLQIYAYLHTIPDMDNQYLEYLRILKENHNLHCNILEIGGGYFPTFASYIQKIQAENGTITVYDPNLATESMNGITLVKQPFTADVSLKPYDLVIGIAACQAQTLIIQKTKEENKNFFLALCGCTHFNASSLSLITPNYANWVNYLEEMMGYTEEQDTIKKLKMGPRFMYYPIYSRNK